MHFLGLRILGKRIKAIYYLLKDPNVKKRKKALVIFGILYLAFPIDLVPVIIFPFGITDDLILWIFIIWHLKDDLDLYWNGEKTVDYSKKYNDKNIVEGVQFEVYEDVPETEGNTPNKPKDEE